MVLEWVWWHGKNLMIMAKGFEQTFLQMYADSQ